MAFFSKIVSKLVGGKSSTHARVSHIEGAERVVVDSSVLCCPVCYEVYASVPSLLGCGHTFCERCVRMMQQSLQVEGYEKHTVFNCPLCRVQIGPKEVFKNYLVDDFLRSIEEVGETESKRPNPSAEIVATLRLAKERATRTVTHLEQQNALLQKEIEQKKKQLNVMNLIVFSAVFGYLIYEMGCRLVQFLS